MIKKMVLIAVLLGTSVPVFAASIFFPASGVVCDKKAGYCADRQGLSLRDTERYLGKPAQVKLDKISRGADVNLQEFTLSNGAHCDAKERWCYTDRYYPRTADKRDLILTRKLYGGGQK